MATRTDPSPAGPSETGPAQQDVAAACAAAVEEYTRGEAGRTRAKSTLLQLAQDHERSYVPHRFLARLLYHEAAVLEGQTTQGQSSASAIAQRLQLLKQALEHAVRATTLAPNSLSAAALRATLVVNVLVEESSLQASAASAEKIKAEFSDALNACSQAASASSPVLEEGVINITDNGCQTCDPCSLRIQDQIQQWVRTGRWDCVVQEKRNVLVCMQQVLQSCHTLLDSTQIPVDGVVRLLQHILRSLLPHRPVHNDLQVWASQLLGSQVMSLAELHAPGKGSHAAAPQPGASAPGTSAGAPAAPPTSATKQASQPLTAPSAPAAPNSKARPSTQPPAWPAGQQPRGAAPAAAKPQQPPVEASSASQPLFEQREWDWDKDQGAASTGATSSGGAAPAAANSKTAAARRKTRPKATNRSAPSGGARGKERGARERYTEVESFWCSLKEDERLELLRVPLSPLLQRMRVEVGQDVVDSVCEGLVMLQEQGMRSTCLWTCVMCDQKFTQAKDFLSHIEVAHEEVAVQGGKYVMCGKCQVEVVGMYYTSNCVADYSLCSRCFQQEIAHVPEISAAYERVYPRAPSVNGPQRWSYTGSGFISSRDSFTCAEDADQLEGPATPKAHRGEGAGTLSSPLKPVDPALAAKHSTSKPLGLPAWGPKPSAPKPNTTSNPATQPPAPTQTPTDPQATNTQPLSSTVPPFAAPPIHAPKPGSAPTQQGPQFGTGTPPWPSGLASSWTKSSQPGSATQERFEFKAEPAEGGGSLGSASHRAAASSMRRSASRNSVGSATRSAHGSPMAQPGSRVGLDGRAGSPVAPAARPAVRLSNPAQPGNCPVANSQDVLASVSTLTGSEKGQLVAVYEEIMQRIRDIYAANHAVGDMALHNIIQFTERKISALLKQHILPTEAPTVRPQLEEFLSQPTCVYQKPEVLQGALRCLSLTDLHMVLVYVVRQHADAVAGDVADPPPTSAPTNPTNPTTNAATAPRTTSSNPQTNTTTANTQAKQAGRTRAEDAQAAAPAPRAGYPAGAAGAAAANLLNESDWESSCECEADDEDDVTDEEECEDECDQECDDEDDECEGETDGEETDEDDVGDVGPPPLFELRVPSMAALHALIANVWNRDDESGDDLAPDAGPPPQRAAGQGAGSSGGGAAGAANGKGGKGVVASGERSDPQDVEEQLMASTLTAEKGRSCGFDPSQQVYIAPSPWWLTHMLDYPPSPAEQAAAQEPARRAHLPVAACAGALRSLQWVYGRVVNTASEVFLKRQREHQSGRDREAALLDLYDDLAFGWRSLQAALDQRARLEELRKGARAQFALVRHIEEEARHCHAEEAAEFLEVLMTTHQAAVGGANALAGAVAGATAVPAGSPSKESLAAREALTMSDHPRINMCEAAVDVVRRHPALAGEPSQRYARALLDRELSALLLIEAMLAAEADEATRARTAVEDNLKKHRGEARDTETEYSRLEAEGPACHRKKDMLDKATKEAEHRERLQDLQQRLVSLTDRIKTEEANKTRANEKLAEAERDLKAVREQLRQHSARRKHLDDLSAQLEVPMPPALMLQQQQQQGRKGQPHVTGLGAKSVPTSLLAPAGSPPSSSASPESADSSTLTGTPHSPHSDADPGVTSGYTLPSNQPGTPPASQTAQILPVPPRHISLSAPPTSPPATTLPAPAALAAPPATQAAVLDLNSPTASAGAAAEGVAPPPAAAPAAPMDLSHFLPGGSLAAASTLEEWHKQRLEVLMYRLMWVSETVKTLQDQYSPKAQTHHYQLFLRATSWAKSLADEYEQQVRGWYHELDKLREKLLEQSCVDLGLVLGQHTLEVMRRRVERAGRMAQERASLLLLAELELEQQAIRIQQHISGGGAGNGAAATAASGNAAGGKASAAKTKKQKLAEKAREKKEREEQERQAKAAEEAARRKAEEEERLRMAEAKRAREVAIEAELERRRKELEALEAQREAEAIRLAQEASLREAAVREAAAAKQRAANPAPAADTHAAKAAAAPACNGVGPHSSTQLRAGPAASRSAAAATQAGLAGRRPQDSGTAGTGDAAPVASAPRVSKHAPKFTSPSAVAAGQGRQSAQSASRLLALAADANKQQQGQASAQTGQSTQGGRQWGTRHTGTEVPAVAAGSAHAAAAAAQAINAPPRAARAPISLAGHGAYLSTRHSQQQQQQQQAQQQQQQHAQHVSAASSMPATPEQRAASGPGRVSADGAASTAKAGAAALQAAPPPAAQPAAQAAAAAAAPAQAAYGAPRGGDMAGVHFNPFAENPLLRALQPPERAISPSVFGQGQSPGSAVHPSALLSHPQSHLTSPRSPDITSQGIMPPSHTGGYSAQSSVHGAFAAPQSPATPLAASEPVSDHILSIMSILEPEAPNNAHSPLAGNVFRSQGSSVPGDGSVGSVHRPGAFAGLGGESLGAATRPVASQHALSGFAQASGMSIWSTAPAEQQGQDSWALHSGVAASAAAQAHTQTTRTHSSPLHAPGSTETLNQFSNAAGLPHWAGSASSSLSTGPLGGQQGMSTGQQGMSSQAGLLDDMASLLPASLLPASLEADTGPLPGSSGYGAGWQQGGASKSTARGAQAPTRSVLTPNAAPWEPSSMGGSAGTTSTGGDFWAAQVAGAGAGQHGLPVRGAGAGQQARGAAKPGVAAGGVWPESAFWPPQGALPPGAAYAAARQMMGQQDPSAWGLQYPYTGNTWR